MFGKSKRAQQKENNREKQNERWFLKIKTDGKKAECLAVVLFGSAAHFFLR
jgi:hypothetical protein